MCLVCLVSLASVGLDIAGVGVSYRMMYIRGGRVLITEITWNYKTDLSYAKVI